MEREIARVQPVESMSQPTISSNRVELIIRNAKQEVVNLRADLGAARIAAVKKEVAAEELRREMAHIRLRASELQQAHDQQQYLIGKQQTELSGVNADRDRLQSEKSAMQRELAELQALREALSASQMAEGQAHIRVSELENAVAALKKEFLPAKAAAMAHEKRMPQVRPPRQNIAVPKDSAVDAVMAADDAGNGRSVASVANTTGLATAAYLAGTVTIDQEWILVTVKPGQTLWDLAREHGTTINQIKAANELVRDVIKSGQQLRVPARISN
ncbi:MAG: LysM peptidoglycan-binding domain-containing protein [Nitrospira sp.]|nr:LysM peptidoglycan-binding domain-containing protein [Nitrospira sp.]